MTQLLQLPRELLYEISGHLAYPDLLALKLTCHDFYYTTNPSVWDRVSWLLERTRLGLPIPQSRKCSMKTDAAFCSNAEVRQILFDRRKHFECMRYGQAQCVVLLEGTSCTTGPRHASKLSTPSSLRLTIPRCIQAIHILLYANAWVLLAFLLSRIL